MYSVTPPYFTVEGANYVLVFKTSIRTRKDLDKIACVLNTCPAVLYWNVDKDDKDNILRIESTTGNISQITAVIRKAGYLCEEIID